MSSNDLGRTLEQLAKGAHDANKLLARRIQEELDGGADLTSIAERVARAPETFREPSNESEFRKRTARKRILLSVLIIGAVTVVAYLFVGSDPVSVAVIAALVAFIKVIAGVISAASEIGDDVEVKAEASKLNHYANATSLIVGFPALLGAAVAIIVESM